MKGYQDIRECPSCFAKTEVIDSRFRGNGLVRRRKCSKCTFRCTTIEVRLEDFVDVTTSKMTITAAQTMLGDVERQIAKLKAGLTAAYHRAMIRSQSNGDEDGTQ